MAASDLHGRHIQNALTKFADDTYLWWAPSSSIETLTDEYENIKQWAEMNNMKIHPSKTKELIVTRARSRTARIPSQSQPLIDGAKRVTSLRVLGVLLDSKLTLSDHVSQVLSACSSSIFALRLLRNHGLCRSDQLHLVARGTTIASILYAPRGGGGLRARGTASAWNGWWPDCGVWVTCQRIFRASRLLLWRLTEIYSSNFVLPPKDNRNFLSRVLYSAICGTMLPCLARRP